MHELASLEADSARPHLELVQNQEVGPVRTIRCPRCKGLRSVSQRHFVRSSGLCKDCRAGEIIHISQFHNYWLKRFTIEEIDEMAGAIWG